MRLNAAVGGIVPRPWDGAAKDSDCPIQPNGRRSEGCRRWRYRARGIGEQL